MQRKTKRDGCDWFKDMSALIWIVLEQSEPPSPALTPGQLMSSLDKGKDIKAWNPLQTQLINRTGFSLTVRFNENMAFICWWRPLGDGRSLLCYSSRSWAQPWPDTLSKMSLRKSETLAILLVNGNAALFLNRLPNQPSPLIDGSEWSNNRSPPVFTIEVNLSF